MQRVDIHRQHCILGAVPAGKNPHCSVTFTDSIGDPDHAVKGSLTYLPNAEARAAEASAATGDDADDNGDDDYDKDNDAAAPRVSLLPAPLIAAPADDDIEIVLPPPLPPEKTKRKRKKATLRERRIDRDAVAAYRPRREEEQGHQKKEKNLQNRRPS
jgi:hypothetical protein